MRDISRFVPAFTNLQARDDQCAVCSRGRANVGRCSRNRLTTDAQPELQPALSNIAKRATPARVVSAGRHGRAEVKRQPTPRFPWPSKNCGAVIACKRWSVPPLAGAAAVTLSLPTRRITGASNVYLATMVPARSSRLAVVTGNLAIRSLTGEEHAHCTLTIGPIWSAGRVIGTFDQAGTGTLLPSTGYPTGTFTITGTFTAASGEVLVLRCTTSGASDAIMLNTHVVIKQLSTQAS